jgi:hypothetical protein
MQSDTQRLYKLSLDNHMKKCGGRFKSERQQTNKYYITSTSSGASIVFAAFCETPSTFLFAPAFTTPPFLAAG